MEKIKLKSLNKNIVSISLHKKTYTVDEKGFIFVEEDDLVIAKNCGFAIFKETDLVIEVIVDKVKPILRKK